MQHQSAHPGVSSSTTRRITNDECCIRYSSISRNMRWWKISFIGTNDTAKVRVVKEAYLKSKNEVKVSIRRPGITPSR